MQEALVERIESIAPRIAVVTLHRTEKPLLPWEPGAHIDVSLPNWLTRQYSLCGSSTDRDRYRIAVRHDRLSRGGSEYVNLFLRAGHRVRISEPRNNFPLVGARRYLFIAGGIGITAILPMMRAVADRPTAQADLVYIGRTEDAMPFVAEIRETFADRARIIATERDGRPDLADLARRLPEDTSIYCCGPAGMLDACGASFPADRLHLERFRRADKTFAPDSPFEVLCARSGVQVTVEPGETMLDALDRAGRPVASGCREGLCASCDLVVLEGTPEHRDDIGAPAGHMYPCVSRSLSARLVVDL
ncbi:PDR/VanB family oxidoreductase [Streptomyces sp. SID3343]|uniref:PDR/VanB family oxidoreductase n=1 Tax=Streptomyces sp. SID3343 TaxID=2690260 RepID=UPI001371F2DB|nr:PDR/VanB family oxidoreductase [Streptomyces sp. SID3343]MYW01616.1 2Fe-2S iron-sulfur cluster binding domain-containing protein [Streptomyces sp. SID3343]